MTPRRAVLLLAAACAFLYVQPAADSSQRFSDDFKVQGKQRASPTWIADSPAWELSGGKYEYAGGPGSFSIFEKAQPAREVNAEITLIVKKATYPDWKVGGLAILQDPQNYWHVALVERPDAAGKAHFVELGEMYRGRWRAESEEATKLTPKFDPAQPLDWEYGHPYRLRIEMNKDTITASVSETDGTTLARLGFSLDNAAVTSGKPALHCTGFRASFDHFAAATSEPVPSAEARFPRFRAAAWPDVRGKATGFYHVELHHGTWWVIDPEGAAFFIIGTDHANYNVHWCESLGYAPYHKFCQEKYGSEQAWAKSTVERLKAWGFNSLAANNSPSLRYTGLAHTEFLSFGQKFAAYDNIAQPVNWTGFPNVFSPKFREFCEQQAALQCAPNKDDPWLLGYFLDNELEWYGKSHSEYGLFDEAFKKPADHSAKMVLVDFLRSRHKTVEAMSRAWGMPVSSFESLLESKEPPPAITPEAKRDKMAFVRKAADLYFNTTAGAIRRADPNHMILGCRFAGQSPNIWDIAGRYCDIVSVNCYRRVDLDEGIEPSFVADLGEWHAAARRPLMITEWSFPALDSGLPCTNGAGERFDTQEQRTRAFSIFQHFLFSQPYMVGSDFFMWVDEPAQGIASTFPENSNYGLVNGQDEPYGLLTQAATRLHRQVYALRSGNTAELSAKTAPNGRGIVLANHGKAQATFIVRAWLDGAKSEKKLTLAPRAEYTYSPDTKPSPGCHSLALIVDPDGEVPERIREDNHALATWYNPGVEWPARARDCPERVPVAVTSGRMPVSDVVVTMPLSSLPWRGPIRVADSSGKLVPFQVDHLLEGAELAFYAGDLRPLACRTFFVYPDSDGRKRGAARTATTFDINNGFLTLRKHSDNGDLADEISAGGIPLGSLRALFELGNEKSDWPRLDRFDSVTMSDGPVRTTMDITVSLADTLQTCYRLTVYPKQRWFAARMLWVKNTGKRPLDIRKYYHYPVPATGGSAGKSVVGPPSVPNYYRTVGLWHDPAQRTCYGALTGKDEFEQVFWIDEHGAYHADLWREINALLTPGQKYDTAQPQACIFGGPCTEPREYAFAIWQQMRARLETSQHAFSPEKRPEKP